MSSAGLQSVTDLVTTLTSGWTSSNTDSVTPTISDNLTIPWGDLKFGATDLLYVKYDTEVITTGMYALDFFHDVVVNIEVMSERIMDPSGSGTNSRAHFKKLMDETARIIKANPRLSGYVHMIIRSTKVRYNKEKGIYVGTIEVEFKKVTTS